MFVFSAKQTPSPGEGRGRGLRPGKGPPPPEEPAFGGFKLKAVPLKFIKKLQNIVLQEAESIGSSAVFECEVSPSTAITSWMKDDCNLRESPKHKFTSDGKDRKLHIIDVQLSDTGDYTCIAKNAGKEISCTAKLIVEGISSVYHKIFWFFFFLSLGLLVEGRMTYWCHANATKSTILIVKLFN